MKLKIVLTIVAALTGTTALIAQDTTGIKKNEKELPKPSIKPYKDVITAKAVTKTGLFTVHKVEDKYYFEIGDSLLGRELLSTTRLIKVPTGSPMYGGEIVNSKTLAFEQGPGNTLFLKVVTLVNIADSTTAISKAVRNANIDPIAMSFDVRARGHNSSVIDVTDFFQKDNQLTGFDPAAKKKMQLGGIATDRSYIESIHPFPVNIETKTIKTYTMSAGGSASGEKTASSEPVDGGSGGVTLELSTSIMMMPKVPMQARYFDPRVGYFADNYKVFSDDQQKVEDNTFIVRFRLEPKEEDMEKYKRGELVEPKQQIVYYVDPATPKQWRPYIIQGINDWNKAFEQAGFKNAIAGKEWPEGDTTMSLEDARYKVVRYFPSEFVNVYAPTIHDPRSGEVLQSYVGWYHNMMRLLHDWYFMQAAAVDPKARKMKFDDELMGSLIRFAVSHEIGNTLGLRNNLGASSQTPVEKLRDKGWVETHGHTVSIMDQAMYNYVAQPEDGIGEKGIMPGIGDYDKWAIQWGYRYTGITNEDADKKITSRWIIDSLQANPGLWFGIAPANSMDPIDPRCQAQDLGDNSMKASTYGIKNLKIVAAHLLEWTKEDNDGYDNIYRMYDQLGGQYNQYARNVISNIGGVYETIKSVEQSGDIYTPVPKSIQKEAIAFLNKEVFQTPTWMLDPNVLNKFRKPAIQEFPQSIQEFSLASLLSSSRLFRMTTESMRFGKEAYTVDEMITDLNKGIWGELNTHQPIDTYRRLLQKKYIDFVFVVLKFAVKPADPNANDYSASDIPAILRSNLDKIRSSILASLPAYKDEVMIAHLRYLADKIKKGINKGSENDESKNNASSDAYNLEDSLMNY